MPIARVVLFVLALGAVLAVVSAYFHRRASTLFRLERRGRRAVAAVLIACLAVLLGGRPLRGLVPDSILAPPSLVAWNIELAIVISVVLFGGVDFAKAVADGVRRMSALARRPTDATLEAAALAPIIAPDPAPPPPAPRDASEAAPRDPSRRAFLTQAAMGSAFAFGGSSALYGFLYGRHDYQLEEIAVPIPGLSRRLDGFTIAQLSDIHLGLFVGEPEMRAAEELVRKARADLIVLTGDLIDHDLRYLPMLGQLTRRLSQHARRGVVVIPGNHDYYAGVDATLDTVSRAGARALRNDGFAVGDAGGAFALLGVDDVWAARSDPTAGPDVDRAAASVSPDLPQILLCHNPIYFPEAAGKVALQLSGHTHGGQVNIGFVRPADWILSHGYVRGLYARGDSRLYVNRGFGTAGPPTRIGAAPEVTRVVLVSA